MGRGGKGLVVVVPTASGREEDDKGACASQASSPRSTYERCREFYALCVLRAFW